MVKEKVLYKDHTVEWIDENEILSSQYFNSVAESWEMRMNGKTFRFLGLFWAEV